MAATADTKALIEALRAAQRAVEDAQNAALEAGLLGVEGDLDTTYRSLQRVVRNVKLIDAK